MFLEPALLDRLVACGTKALRAESVSIPSNDPGKIRLAIGFSAEHTHVSDATAFYVVQDGALKPIVKSKVGALGRRIVAMTGFQDRRNSQFVAYPVRKLEFCVAGMSGGIVIEVDVGTAIRDFALLESKAVKNTKCKRTAGELPPAFS